VETLVNHYREHELPDIFCKDDLEKISDEQERKSYSTPSTYDAPNAEGRLELTVERLPNGEVSPYLTNTGPNSLRFKKGALKAELQGFAYTTSLA
jgi:hypothetical protein